MLCIVGEWILRLGTTFVDDDLSSSRGLLFQVAGMEVQEIYSRTPYDLTRKKEPSFNVVQ